MQKGSKRNEGDRENNKNRNIQQYYKEKGETDENTMNMFKNNSNNRKKKWRKKDKAKKRKYGNDSGTQRYIERLKDRYCITDPQRTILQYYNKQQQKEPLKVRNKKLLRKQQIRQQV